MTRTAIGREACNPFTGHAAARIADSLSLLTRPEVDNLAAFFSGYAPGVFERKLLEIWACRRGAAA
jgi:hypothetical protein